MGTIMLLKEIFFASIYFSLYLHGMETTQSPKSSPVIDKLNILIAAAHEEDIYIDPRLTACAHCGKILINIKAHIKKVHKEKLHTCSCGNRYMIESHLVAHQRTCPVNRAQQKPYLNFAPKKIL